MEINAKCINNIFNLHFQNEATIEFKFNLQQSCRARGALSLRYRSFSNLLIRFSIVNFNSQCLYL